MNILTEQYSPYAWQLVLAQPWHNRRFWYEVTEEVAHARFQIGQPVIVDFTRSDGAQGAGVRMHQTKYGWVGDFETHFDYLRTRRENPGVRMRFFIFGKNRWSKERKRARRALLGNIPPPLEAGDEVLPESWERLMGFVDEIKQAELAARSAR